MFYCKIVQFLYVECVLISPLSTQEDVITLCFRYGDIPPVLESNDNNSITSSTSEDSEEEEEGGEILLVTCQDQLLDSTINTDTVINRRRSGGNSNSSTVYPKYTSQGSRESLTNHQNFEHLVDKDSHPQRKSRRSSSSTYSTSSQYENSPRKAVINPEDRFLSLFTDHTADTDNGKYTDYYHCYIYYTYLILFVNIHDNTILPLILLPYYYHITTTFFFSQHTILLPPT